jgi:hypothetical protein
LQKMTKIRKKLCTGSEPTIAIYIPRHRRRFLKNWVEA